jgi:hypothetical protein
MRRAAHKLLTEAAAVTPGTFFTESDEELEAVGGQGDKGDARRGDR